MDLPMTVQVNLTRINRCAPAVQSLFRETEKYWKYGEDEWIMEGRGKYKFFGGEELKVIKYFYQVYVNKF